MDNIDCILDIPNAEEKYKTAYDTTGNTYVAFTLTKKAHLKYKYPQDVGTWYIPTKLYTYPKMLEIIKKFYPNRTFESGLDIGCGTTSFFEMFTDIKNTLLIDISTPICQYMKSKNFAVMEMNVEQMSFDNKSFDLIICSDVLEHVLSFDAAISQIERVLTDDGVLCINVPWEQNVSRLRLSAFSHLRRFSRHNVFTRFSNFTILEQQLIVDGDKYGWIRCMNILLKKKQKG